MENLTFDYDTDEYIVEPTGMTANELILRSLKSVYRAGAIPRDIN